MAKRRKKTGTTRRRGTSRRRSMGGTASGLLMDVLAVTGGAILAKQVPKLLGTMDARIVNGALVVAGAMLPKVIKTPMGQSIGLGIVAVAGSNLVGNFVPALGGVEDDVIVLSGLDEIGDISEVNGLPEVNGLDDIGTAEEEM